MNEFRVIEKLITNDIAIKGLGESVSSIIKILKNHAFIMTMLTAATGVSICENVLYEKKMNKTIEELQARITELELKNGID